MKRRGFLKSVAALAVLPAALEREAKSPFVEAPPIPWEEDEYGYYWEDYTVVEEFNTAQKPVGWWVSYCEDAVECGVPTFAMAEAIVLMHKDLLERRHEGLPGDLREKLERRLWG